MGGKTGLAAHLEAVPEALRTTPELQRVDGLLTKVYSVATAAVESRIKLGASPVDQAGSREELLAGQALVESEKQFHRLFDEFQQRFSKVQELSSSASLELSRLQAMRKSSTATPTATVSITGTVAAADAAAASMGAASASAADVLAHAAAAAAAGNTSAPPVGVPPGSLPVPGATGDPSGGGMLCG